ncbi:cerebellin-3-like [Littorina saxatilis]|uniref:C1q domain-containing protein n=1 Tax=Littorina saxatilis TaxID=31220 RepID=A0AAN9BUT5_9CAEN
MTFLFWSLAALIAVLAETKHDSVIKENDVYSMTSVRIRRSDDTDRLTPVVSQHSQELVELKAELTALKARTAELENIVCFTVRFSEADVTGLGLNQPVVFDVVQYNAGGGYDKNSGIFTAPKAGTYVFTLSLQRHGSDGTYIQMVIKKGNTVLGTAEAGYSPFEHGTMMVTTHLTQGDVISVQTTHGSMVYGVQATSFSGVRISPL